MSKTVHPPQSFNTPDSYVFDYEKALRGLQKRKAMSDWFLASGYTGDYEGKQEYKRSIVVDELD